MSDFLATRADLKSKRIPLLHILPQYHQNNDSKEDHVNAPCSRISFIARVRPSFIGVWPFADKLSKRRYLSLKLGKKLGI